MTANRFGVFLATVVIAAASAGLCAAQSGGGIFNPGMVTLTNSTVSARVTTPPFADAAKAVVLVRAWGDSEQCSASVRVIAQRDGVVVADQTLDVAGSNVFERVTLELIGSASGPPDGDPVQSDKALLLDVFLNRTRQSSTRDCHRYTFGIEKTFFDGEGGAVQTWPSSAGGDRRFKGTDNLNPFPLVFPVAITPVLGRIVMHFKSKGSPSEESFRRDCAVTLEVTAFDLDQDMVVKQEQVELAVGAAVNIAYAPVVPAFDAVLGAAVEVRVRLLSASPGCAPDANIGAVAAREFIANRLGASLVTFDANGNRVGAWWR